MESDLKRYPAGFVKKHGPKNLVLANAYISKTAKGTTLAYSPTFIAESTSDSILVTVPTTMACFPTICHRQQKAVTRTSISYTSGTTDQKQPAKNDVEHSLIIRTIHFTHNHETYHPLPVAAHQHGPQS